MLGRGLHGVTRAGDQRHHVMPSLAQGQAEGFEEQPVVVTDHQPHDATGSGAAVSAVTGSREMSATAPEPLPERRRNVP